MHYSIMFISPNQQIADLVKEVCTETGEDIQVEIGDLNKGVEIAQNKEEEVDAIISRGGTALGIKERINLIAVMEIQVSKFDIVRALHKSKQYSNKVGVIGFKNVIYGTESMEEILGLSIEKYELEGYTVDNEELVAEKIMEAKQDDVEVIVGDTISVKLAEEIGLKGEPQS